MSEPRIPEPPIDPPRDIDAEMAEAAEDAGVTVAEYLSALEPDWGDVINEREYYDHGGGWADRRGGA